MQARLEKMQAHVVSLTARLQQVCHAVSCYDLITNETVIADSCLEVGEAIAVLLNNHCKFALHGSIMYEWQRLVLTSVIDERPPSTACCPAGSVSRFRSALTAGLKMRPFCSLHSVYHPCAG